MTKEELLKPRYKVIAEIPFHSIAGFNTIPIGHIFNYESIHPIGASLGCSFKDYPHLFRKLEWYQDRKIDDMPMYLKHGKKIIKVKEWQDDGTGELFYLDQYDWDEYPDRGHLPATKEEYEAYIQKQTTNG